MLLGKRLELLHEWFPRRLSLEILVNPDAADAEPEIGEVTAPAAGHRHLTAVGAEQRFK
jgi:hypothetical protein